MRMLNPFLKLFAFMLFIMYGSIVFATQYSLPSGVNALVGDIQYVSAGSQDTPTAIAERYNLGLNAVIAANGGTTENILVPVDGSVLIPTEFILPELPRKGIVINLPEMRLYYYPPNSNVVMTFPIGIGRIGKTIPITNTVISRKVINPVWTPPEDIRQFNLDKGIDLPDVMPAGPDNPLGPYAIYLRIPTFLIHSTIFPESIGQRASFGCIRMNEGDIKQFFPLVEAGTPVAIINMPNKVGWSGNQLYLEAHPPLTEHSDESSATANAVVDAIQNSLPADHVTLVNWQLVAELVKQPDGVPHVIGVRVN